jgi:hypothetical protein
MIISAYQRALAALAAFGSVLALTLVAVAPAAEAAPKGCTGGGYPSSIQTSTSLRLARNFGSYGQRNVAHISVSSAAGRPGGTVTLAVNGNAYALALHGGQASQSLPSNLAASHTYGVTATYPGQGCYAPSSSSTSYTVFPGESRTHGLSARSIRRGGHPRVTGRVSTATGARAKGRVSVKLYYHGDLKKSGSATLHGGRFSASFGRVTQVGTWTVRVTPLSGGSSDDTSFRVSR